MFAFNLLRILSQATKALRHEISVHRQHRNGQIRAEEIAIGNCQCCGPRLWSYKKETPVRDHKLLDLVFALVASRS